MKKIHGNSAVTAESIARMADKGEDVSRFFTKAGRRGRHKLVISTKRTRP